MMKNSNLASNKRSFDAKLNNTYSKAIPVF
ncbi:hypothetical protein SAMN04489722_107149 [Algibacter lectus]|nr:hypothetical protein SAMN04489722_107149 [Algibacter lectus]